MGRRELKKGFTTGSCAAAASKAAAYMLLSGRRITKIGITTPSGEEYSPAIEEIKMCEDHVSCAIRKQSGDDPDITDGILVFAKVCFASEGQNKRSVIIDGGKGIGTVTRPGLDQPVGNAAINSVPRKMIEEEVLDVMDLFGYPGGLSVEVSVPEGAELARKTFNPRLGIEGGISIIGTTGIVEPMSTKALLDTIRVELKQQKALGNTVAVVSPGNYGLGFMKDHYDYDLDRAVKCSNYIGDAVDMAADEGFNKMLLCGHVGKLIKVSGGIMNTHSREADCRMELMASAAISCGASSDIAREILVCVSAEEAAAILIREGLKEKCFSYISEKISYYLNNRSAGRMNVQHIMYSNEYGLLARSEKADEFIKEAKGCVR